MMNRYTCLLAVSAVVWAAPALAQEHRAELTLLAGWALADGVEGGPVVTADGNTYDRVDPKDSLKWGLGLGIFVNESAEVGFLFGQQRSTLEASGTSPTEIGDMDVDSYHGYFAYNFLDEGAKVRPYLMGGLGATHFGTVDYTRSLGQSGTIGGITRFSSIWGAGVKVYANEQVGARFNFQWMPTYIKSDAVGWWCDPFWGCYVVGNAQYSNQVEFSGGIIFRF
jgi:hypothetical protein